MNLNIKATNMDLTEAISDYVDKRLEGIKKFVKDGEMITRVEVGRTTNHHKQGDLFRAEFDIKINGNKFYTFSEKEDLYEAIDDAREEIVRQVTSKKNKEKTLFKRGALSVKKMLKGVTKRNPFTSKY
jgi:ribosomal subunit interface protein